MPVGPLEPSFAEYLALVLPESLGLSVTVATRPLSVDSAYDPVRRQWNALSILARLDECEEARAHSCVLGLTAHDLFIPIFTFVFGLARLGARGAVISLHRLRSEIYGLPPDPERVLLRLEKEAVHELGHTQGLRHCPDYSCVMHFSNSVEEVDLKTAAFCPACRALRG